jgi:CheY-like chemotaxis protein
MFQAFDIFKRDSAGGLIWVEAAKDVPSAQSRLLELAASSPGAYLIFSHKTETFLRSDDIAAENYQQAQTFPQSAFAEQLGRGRDFSTAQVLLADDNELIRKLIREALSDRKVIQVCGEAVDGKEAVEKAVELKPDVVILDLSMSLGGLAAAKQIVATLPQTRILLMPAHDGLALTKEAKAAGVRGFVRKDQASATLLKAVETLLSGQTFFPREPLS